MTTANASNLPSDMNLDRPFTFKGHNFGAHCFNTIGCKVLYAGRYVAHDEDDENSRQPPFDESKYGNLSASHLDIANFPKPAVVTWKSKDGVSHKAEIDIGEIFKDQIIRHKVRKEEFSEETIPMNDQPDIILVVNDRTITIHMSVRVYLTAGPDGKRVARDESELCFRKTY